MPCLFENVILGGIVCILVVAKNIKMNDYS